MAISGIQNSQYLSQVFQTSQTNPSTAMGGDGDGDGSAGRAGNSTFASALMNALSQSGITVGSTSSGTTTPSSGASQSPQQALQSFMQNLFAALHAQSSGQNQTGENDRSGAAAAGAMGSHHGGIGKMEANLQSLIQQLSSGTSMSPVDASLQQSYQNLIGTQGATGNQSSLTSLLQTLSQNLQGVGMTGNIVNSQG